MKRKSSSSKDQTKKKIKSALSTPTPISGRLFIFWYPNGYKLWSNSLGRLLLISFSFTILSILITTIYPPTLWLPLTPENILRSTINSYLPQFYIDINESYKGISLDTASSDSYATALALLIDNSHVNQISIEYFSSLFQQVKTTCDSNLASMTDIWSLIKIHSVTAYSWPIDDAHNMLSSCILSFHISASGFSSEQGFDFASVTATFRAIDSLETLGLLDTLRGNNNKFDELDDELDDDDDEEGGNSILQESILYVASLKDSSMDTYPDCFGCPLGLDSTYHALQVLSYSSSVPLLQESYSNVVAGLSLYQTVDGGYSNEPLESFEEFAEKEGSFKSSSIALCIMGHLLIDSNAPISLVGGLPVETWRSSRNFFIFSWSHHLSEEKNLEALYWGLEATIKYPDLAGIPRGVAPMIIGSADSIPSLGILCTIFIFYCPQLPTSFIWSAVKRIGTISTLLLVSALASSFFSSIIAFGIYVCLALLAFSEIVKAYWSIPRKKTGLVGLKSDPSLNFNAAIVNSMLYLALFYFFIIISPYLWIFSSSVYSALILWLITTTLFIVTLFLYSYVRRDYSIIESAYLTWLVISLAELANLIAFTDFESLLRITRLRGDFLYLFFFFPLFQLCVSYISATLACTSFLYVVSRMKSQHKSEHGVKLRIR